MSAGIQAAPVLVVEDDPSLAEAVVETLSLAGHEVLVASDATAALAIVDAQPLGLVISDVQMEPMDGHALLAAIKTRQPELPVVLMTAYGTIEKAVQSIRDGAAHYIVKPFEADTLVQVADRFKRRAAAGDGLIAADSRSHQLKELARRVAASEATVMIAGESGTGKEVLARFIHDQSSRSSGPFVAINCAAIPENMLEAVLFGYEKGAFTGATTANPGKFEQAQGGTLLLDEVSEMDLGLQAKLLRVLQEREVERLGGRKVVSLDVRVLATTNRDLREFVNAGQFREDLYYRLNVFPLNVPPLRERPEDILPLCQHFMQRHCAGRPSLPVWSDEARDALLAHPWQGNVRELDNLVQRTLIIATGGRIEKADLVFEAGTADLAAAVPAQPAPELQKNLKDREQALIVDALEKDNGCRKLAAKRLGISPRTLRYKLARLRDAGVSIPEFGRAHAVSA
ncbi:MAG: sigma-54 dependent transcriptional regulator [Pseudomonadota bacterium]